MWKPGSITPFVDIKEEDGAALSTPTLTADYANVAVQRETLPIAKFKRLILYSIEHYRVTVLVGETGCGKSTQIPQYLYPYWCRQQERRGIVITQPRRMAAINLAKRVQTEMQDDGGDIVGYRVRFDDRTTSTTAIHYVTDGTLVREATLHDPLLSAYSVIVVDECHERTLHTDILLGLLKKLLKQRPNDLRIILCSATVDAQAMLDFFVPPTTTATTDRPKKKSRWGGKVGEKVAVEEKKKKLEEGTILSVDGRQYPVEIHFLENPVADYVASTVDTALQIHNNNNNNNNNNYYNRGGKHRHMSVGNDNSDKRCDDGDILCFLPSEKDIHHAISMTEEILQEEVYHQYKQNKNKQQKNNRRDVICLPLYSSLPQHLQKKVFLPVSSSSQARKIIFATNVAETSVTIPNITNVIDCGFVKLPFFDPINGLDRLIVTPISHASAQQRAGRAGRVRSGKCYRLYTETAMSKQMEKVTAPAVLRSNLTSFVLLLKNLGVHNILAFDYITVPSVAAFSHSLETLYLLGFISKETTDLTSLGHKLADFPTEPRVSKMLYESLAHECSEQVLCLAAASQVQSSLWHAPPKKEGTRQSVDYQASMEEVADDSGDHMTIINIMENYQKYHHKNNHNEVDGKFLHISAVRRAWEVHSQLRKCLGRFGSLERFDNDEKGASNAILRCVTAGFFGNAAKLSHDGNYYTIRGKQMIKIGSNSILQQKQSQHYFHNFGERSSNSRDYLIFVETYDGGRGEIEVRSCSYIQGKWLQDMAPHYFI